MMRVLVLTPTIPRTLDERTPWHFFQELRPIAERGVRLAVVSGFEPQYRIPGIEFFALRPQSLKRYPQHIPSLMRFAHKHRDSLPPAKVPRLARILRIAESNRAIVRIARQWRPDVIHSHWAFPVGSAGAAAAGDLGLPLIMTLRGIDHLVNLDCGYGDCLDPIFEGTFRAAARHAHALTVCCNDSLRRLHALGITPDDGRIRMIYHAVNRERFSGTDDEAERVKDSLGLAGQQVISCVAGMDHERKGHRSLLRAFALLARRRAEGILLLVGDGPLRTEFEQVAVELGIRERVVFPGRVHPTEVEHYLRMSTVSVLPTLTEAFGNVVFESLAVGTPVIASSVGTPGDLLPRGPFGFVFEPGNIDQLYERINQVLDDLPVARQMAKRGGDFVRKELTLDRRADAFVGLYEELLSCRKSSHRDKVLESTATTSVASAR